MLKRARIPLALACLAALVVPAAAAGTSEGAPHYPDLITKAPFSIRLASGKGLGTTRRLFFGNTIGNIGEGPLELRAENDAATGLTDAYQEIYTHLGPWGGGGKGGGGQITLLSSSLVGIFVFHPLHNHWHMADFARYELRAINPDGSTGNVVASTDKFSFCMIDTDVLDATLAHYNMGLTHSCGQSARQGVRVGRGDTYAATLPDQFIDITTVPDGTYRLVSVADPNTPEKPTGQMIELNDHNNAASIDVVITRTAVTPVPGTERTGIDAP
jgi:hypothetical protein